MSKYLEIGVGGTFSTNLVCPDCGSLVWDTRIHDRWHDSLESARPTGME